MKEISGNIWDYHDKGHWIVITTNGTVKANGKAVMGRGVAQQAKRRFPNMSGWLGCMLNSGGNQPYANRLLRIITFPVKDHWKQKAEIPLIEKSCKYFVEGVQSLGLVRIYMVRPGCGNGQLDWKIVKPILEKYLDDRFIVVERET